MPRRRIPFDLSDGGTLGELVDRKKDLPDRGLLYVAGRPPWTERTEVLVLYDEDLLDENGDYGPASARGLAEQLTMGDVRDILDCLAASEPGHNRKRAVEAVNFYTLHDAFIEPDDRCWPD